MNLPSDWTIIMSTPDQRLKGAIFCPLYALIYSTRETDALLGEASCITRRLSKRLKATVILISSLLILLRNLMMHRWSC